MNADINSASGRGCCATYNKEAGARLAERNACPLDDEHAFPFHPPAPTLKLSPAAVAFGEGLGASVSFQPCQITLKRALAFIVFGKKVVQHPRPLALSSNKCES